MYHRLKSAALYHQRYADSVYFVAKYIARRYAFRSTVHLYNASQPSSMYVRSHSTPNPVKLVAEREGDYLYFLVVGKFWAIQAAAQDRP